VPAISDFSFHGPGDRPPRAAAASCGVPASTRCRSRAGPAIGIATGKHARTERLGVQLQA